MKPSISKLLSIAGLHQKTFDPFAKVWRNEPIEPADVFVQMRNNNQLK